MAQRNLSIIYRSIDSIQLDPQNPRLHSKKQVQQIARSIETFGFNVPILIDAQGNLMAGHGRLLAAQLLGMAEVPTVALEHLSENQRRAFAIADNRLTENSVWDDRLLYEQLETLSVLKLDFSLEVTGFEMKEINMRIESLAPGSSGNGDRGDGIPDCATRPKVTRPSDLWILGLHRVYCGDAREDSTYSRLMEGRQAKMVFVDPPCNDAPGDTATGLRKTNLQTGRLTESDFTDFLKNVLSRLARNSADGGLHFICMDWQQSGALHTVARSIYTELADLCIWIKDDAEQGSLYRSQHELIFVFRKGKAPDRNNIQLSQHARHRTNVWRYRRNNSLSQKRKEGSQFAFQGTIKPVELVADAILDCTVSGDVVLDPFLGSGTTVIAVERTSRACYGIELDPRSVDLIVRRWQAFTRKNAVHASTGRTFNEMEEEDRGRAE